MPTRWHAADLVSLRVQLGLSQADLGNKVGVDQTTVSRWERGVQEPKARALVQLSGLMYRLDLSRKSRPEVALVELSPFPMSIVTADWLIIALSDSLLNRGHEPRRQREAVQSKKRTTAEMEQAVAALRARGFFEGKVYAARILARSFVLDNKPRPFEALCTPVLIDSQICRLTQYFFLSEAEFAERRSKEGLVTFLGSNL